MAGFGNVGREFSKLLLDKREELFKVYGTRLVLAGVSTRSKGTLISDGEKGLDIRAVLDMDDREHRFDRKSPYFVDCGVPEMIERCGADVFMELTTLSINDGEPATGYIEKAFGAGMHVITANKGPEAWHFSRLAAKAKEKDRLFLYETVVMDGAPIFNLAQETLHGNKILGIRGILNGTSNFVLEQLEKGISFGDAVKEAQRIQIAEADPSMDIDGWDGAAKICALANILMDANLNPKNADVTSISDITPEIVRNAKSEGFRIKYICKAERSGDEKTVKLSVKPCRLPLDDFFCCVNGTSAAVTFYTDLAGEISIVQTDPGILQTAYGVYSDLITLIKKL